MKVRSLLLENNSRKGNGLPRSPYEELERPEIILICAIVDRDESKAEVLTRSLKLVCSGRAGLIDASSRLFVVTGFLLLSYHSACSFEQTNTM